MTRPTWGLAATPAPVLAAVGACAAAVLVQLFAPPGLAVVGSSGQLGNLLFRALATEVVGFAVPAAYFRLVVPAHKGESNATGLLAGVAVGAAAFANLRFLKDRRVDSYALLFGVLTASYVFVSKHVGSWFTSAVAACTAAAVVAGIIVQGWALHAIKGAFGIWAATLGDHLYHKLLTKGYATDSSFTRWSTIAGSGVGGLVFLPALAAKVATFLLPIHELTEAYLLVGSFVGREKLDAITTRLMIVTAFCQVSLGYLGIAFLRRGQERKNALLQVGEGKVTAWGYARIAFFYMTAAALPYMLQRTIIENVNHYVFGHIRCEVERSLRISSFFPGRPSGHSDMLLAAIHGSKFTVEGYADALNGVVYTMYYTVESKLFALPKLMLLPGMLANQPWLVVCVLPASIALDVGRARMITMMARRIEALSREIQELANRRRKIEQHDTRNEELIRRGAASGFTEGSWRELAAELEDRSLRWHALRSLSGFINALYRQDFLGPGIELVLAWLLQFKQITISDIWVYTRVVEDAIDLLLTRFRMDATLATLKTNMDRVAELSGRLERARTRGRATCSLEPSSSAIRIAGLTYARGASLEVVLSELVLRAGRIYAVTGANGSGKSSLFGILASCGSSATMLPDGLTIKALESLALPSSDVVEITQQLYCPLFVKPLAWLLQRRDLDAMPAEELQRYERQIQQLSGELEFHSKDDSTVSREAGVMSAAKLREEAEDWYGALSGGQRCKVEFIRKVFLRDQCPQVLLIDEAFAPLDPRSKMLMQRKLKDFCAGSVVLVIYHGGARETCVASEGFFDEVLHFSNGTASLTKTC